MERRGAFSVALGAIRWRRLQVNEQMTEPTALEHDELTKQVWVGVTLDALALDGVWFASDEENATTKTVELTCDTDGQLEYAQSSRPLTLCKETLVALLDAQLRVAVYIGSTRTSASDALWGEAKAAFLPALLRGRRHETLRIADASGEEITVEMTIQCDVDLAEYALGARVLRIHSLRIVQPPSEWTLPGASNDEEAMRLCSALDRNTAVYEVEIPLPDFSDDGEQRSDEIVRFTGGKLEYTPSPSATRAMASDTDTTTIGLSGEWSIAFPIGLVNKFYPKPSVSRLLDFLQVEKSTSGTLRRANVEAAGRVTATVAMNLHELTSPGATRVCVEAPLKKLSPLPKEVLEQELAGAASNDEKKRLQALIGDYDAAIVQVVTALSKAARAAKTRIECVVEILGNGPLVLDPPATPAPTRGIDELIPPRDLSDEYDQRKDVVADLRTEIRRVVLTVLHEYEDIGPNEASASRDEKRQRIVFKLNSQGTYHEFKEKLKKRIVPMIRDRFADELAASEHGKNDPKGEDGSLEPLVVSAKSLPGSSRVNTHKKAYFASVYNMLMDEVQGVLHETFYVSSPSPLEKAHSDIQPRDDVKVTLKLTTLGLQALENEVNGDVEKSEALHLDRIAFAEERSIEMPHLAATMRPSLGSVWLDYAKFCLGQGELDKAGGAFRQCLSLEPHAIDALVAYGALLCELRDFTAADVAIKNAVSEALAQERTPRGVDESNALQDLVTVHALLALHYSESKTDETGNLVLFELLKAQTVLRRLQQTTNTSSNCEPCLSSVWIHLAAAVHVLRLRSVTLTALQFADQFHRPRDVLTGEERVQKRVILAEVLSLRGEGDRATTVLEEALEIDRSHAFAWFVLGKTYLQLESQTNAAIESLQRSLEGKQRLRTDQRLSLYIHLGLVLLQSAQFGLAKAVFLSACEEFALASTWLGVGIASLRMEQWDAAQVALAEANRLDATNPEVWGYLALLALSAMPRVTSQHEQRAKQCVAQAVRFHLSNPALLRELSSGFVAIDRLEDAECLLRRALVFQDSSLARKTLADVLAAQNCAEAALAQYKHSLDESQDLSHRRELLEKCASLLVTLGRSEEATECRDMAAQLHLSDIPGAPGTPSENHVES